MTDPKRLRCSFFGYDKGGSIRVEGLGLFTEVSSRDSDSSSFQAFARLSSLRSGNLQLFWPFGHEFVVSKGKAQKKPYLIAKPSISHLFGFARGKRTKRRKSSFRTVVSNPEDMTSQEEFPMCTRLKI